MLLTSPRIRDESEFSAVGVHEVHLRQVPVQVLAAHAMVEAVDRRLQLAEEPLGQVGPRAPGQLPHSRIVVHPLMAGGVRGHRAVAPAPPSVCKKVFFRSAISDSACMSVSPVAWGPPLNGLRATRSARR